MNTDDQYILASFRDDDTRDAAFTALVQKYQEQLYWHIRRLAVTHEDTDDILQMVFVKAWKNLDGFRGDSSIYTWLYRIATNEALTFLKKEKKRRSVSLDTEEGLMSDKLIAEKGFDARLLEWQLQNAIQMLPEKQRVVFSLRYYDEMPYEKMSEILDTSEGALKASYHHAAKKVEEYIKKELNEKGKL